MYSNVGYTQDYYIELTHFFLLTSFYDTTFLSHLGLFTVVEFRAAALLRLTLS